MFDSIRHRGRSSTQTSARSSSSEEAGWAIRKLWAPCPDITPVRVLRESSTLQANSSPEFPTPPLPRIREAAESDHPYFRPQSPLLPTSPSANPFLHQPSPSHNHDNKNDDTTNNNMMATRSLLSVSSSGPAVYKQRAIKEAEQQQKAINEKLRKLGLEPTGYQFKELIGKGSYGRVYKSFHADTGRVVAVKVLETDAMDFDAKGPNRDAGMEDALKEIGVLRRLKQSKAENVNQFHDAFQVHSQLWIISEYCSGGSLTTLRRATGNKLSERHIIPIARELALGLKSVHEAGIVHRDVKCSNVMINEDGRLQIIDFGVAGILLSNLDVDKRKTIIGTPHWMPPEMQQNAAEIAHGTEVDVWAFGITLYECATGAPPNARTMPGRELMSMIRQRPAPRLPENCGTPELRDLVAFVLDADPSKRPNMAQICQHKYILGTEESHPTSTLRELVKEYYLWEHSGGQRASLFMQGGAAQPKFLQDQDDEDEEWNFSTTANFEKQNDPELDPSFSFPPRSEHQDSNLSLLSSSPPMESDEQDESSHLTLRYLRENEPSINDIMKGTKSEASSRRPSASKSFKSSTDQEMESRVAHGKKAMEGVFNLDASPYKYSYKSDLPFRTEDSTAPLHSKEVSVSSTTGAPHINLESIPGKRSSKRKTMAWTWDDNLGPAADEPLPPPPQPDFFPLRPQLKHAATMAVVPSADRPVSKTLDLDALMGGDTFTMPAAASYNDAPLASTSAYGDNTFSQEPMDSFQADMAYTMRPSNQSIDYTTDSMRTSGLDQYPPSLYAPEMTRSTTESSAAGSSTGYATHTHTHAYQTSNPLPPPPGHNIHNSSSMPASAYTSAFPSALNSAHNSYAFPPPIPPAALADNAPPEVMQEALEDAINGWVAQLQLLDQAFQELEDESEGEDDDDDEEQEEDERGSEDGYGDGDEGSVSMSEVGGWDLGGSEEDSGDEGEGGDEEERDEGGFS